MDYQSILFFLMQFIFIFYIGYIWLKYGALKSISESYYALPRKLRPLFTLALWGFAIPAIIIGDCGLMFLAGSGIAFVGAAAQMHEQFVRKVHVTAAIIGITAGHLAIIFNYHMWWITVAFVLASIPFLIFDKKTRIWWVEILAFLSISIALAFQIF